MEDPVDALPGEGPDGDAVAHHPGHADHEQQDALSRPKEQVGLEQKKKEF